MKKITVIMPVYNTAEFLQESVYSVMNQTYNHLELMLINDGSEESCTELIEQLSQEDARILPLHINENKGVGFARNLGVEKASHDYIYFLDSDDYLPPHTLELLVNHINDHDMISGSTILTTTKVESTDIKPEATRVNQTLEKSFDNISALNRLIKLDFIKSHQIKFSEEVTCYADLPFIVDMMHHLNVTETPMIKEASYSKRVRNDPISNPALVQLDANKKAVDFLTVYLFLKDNYKNSDQINMFLDDHLLSYYKLKHHLFYQDQATLPLISAAVQKSSTQPKQKLNSFVKAQWKSLKNENYKKFIQQTETEILLKDIKTALSGRTKLKTFLYKKVFTRLPLKEKSIVFESFLGKNYSDSPKNIYEYMLENNPDYQFIWIFNKKREIPGNAKQVKRFSLQYYYYLATSKYWVSNSRIPLHLNKREGNVYLQTWHGTPLKKLVFDMNEVYSANPKYKGHFFEQSRRWDYLISANQYSSDIFKRAFKFDKQMLEFGYPRNDMLHSNIKETNAKKVKEKLNIPADKKVILYAPTWRDDDFYAPGKYKFKLMLDLEKMKNELGDEYVILLRMHYFIADHIETTGVEDFAYNLSKYDDIAELYLISDILITDYSSVFFDYSNLKRPILFYTYDLEKYRDTLRGFYIDMEEEVPGPLLKSTEEIISAISNIEEVERQYEDKYARFYNKFCGWEKGHATEKAVQTVFKD
ncbi:bifunctional glycosyltransferase/CDP-glycerol:glycerophosphate glycerophosphotransferase [Cytobacillus purgationiresistens]|uniref:CDP-glycerol glycerophosphotransferase n=1 Tax=Cytobacillus purgationiresistens TaxID=863449 RepID=A0ABU0ACY1_9BACI|nr:CDP-glycerol:glycerophosphate glycerophosphotransferase [Cytobacillus purgationiresistens]MDQ0269114.1 CDP-glycerol glycerophosphotransferase [Cytobacillus purgationiresistens]